MFCINKYHREPCDDNIIFFGRPSCCWATHSIRVEQSCSFRNPHRKPDIIRISLVLTLYQHKPGKGPVVCLTHQDGATGPSGGHRATGRTEWDSAMVVIT